jgi:pre-mRNA-splicing factor 18
LRNDLKAALDKIDQQYLNEIVGGQEPGEEDTQNDLKVHEENTTIEELEVIPTFSLHILYQLFSPGADG